MSQEGAQLQRGAWAQLRQARVLPGKRLLVLVGLGMLPLLAAPFWWDALYVVIAFDLALLAGMGLDYLNLKRGLGLRVRRVREARLSVGADNPVTLEFEHLGQEPALLWARDSYPGEFEAAGDDIGTNDELTLGQELAERLARQGKRQRSFEGLLGDEDRDLQAEREEDRGARGLRRRLARELTPGGDAGPGLELAPGQKVAVTYRLTPLRRGDYHFGRVYVRAQTRLGLATLAAVAELEEPVSVYPDIRGVRQLGLATRFRDLKALGLKNIRRDGGGGEFEKLRDYVQGDALRDINWKATARRRKPITQIHGVERSQSVLLCIDAGRLMASRSGELLKLDHAINAALMLAWTALQGGDRVGLVVFAQEVRTWISPGRGQGQYKKILRALYGVEAERGHVDYAAFFKVLMARARRRSLVVLFTDLYDEASARPLVEYTKILLPRHLPLCVTLRDEQLHQVRHQIPEEAQEVFSRAVATEVMREREVLKADLGRLGAHVIDRPAGELTVGAINAYVDLRRRRL